MRPSGNVNGTNGNGHGPRPWTGNGHGGSTSVLKPNPNVSRDAERLVLGAMIRDNAAIDDVAGIVHETDFYIDVHQRIFSLVVGLRTIGQPVDMVTLYEEVRLAGWEKDIKPDYLVELWNAAPTSANVCFHARIVRDRALFRSLARVADEIAEIAANPNQSAAKLLEEAERKVFALSEVGIRGAAVPLSGALAEARERMRLRSEGKSAGTLTGFCDLDSTTAGLHPGELVVVGARPSVGKTAYAICVARNVAITQRLPVFFVSLEQSNADVAERLLCSEASVESSKARRGFLSSEENDRIAEASERLGAGHFFLDQTAGQTLMHVAANARRLQSRSGRLGLIVLDYLQLLLPEDTNVSRNEQVGASSRRLKLLAQELQVPVLCLAQLNRQVEQTNREPRLSDLRDSGEIEQHADTVMFLHRPEHGYGVIDMLVRKQRNGPLGDIRLTFEREYYRFANHAPIPEFQHV